MICGQNSSRLGVHVATQKYHWQTLYSSKGTNRNATYSIPIRVHSAQFKDNASKLSGEMRRGKRASHRYTIDKPCIGGTQLQELYREQTVWLSSALLCWEMQMSSLPNEGQAQLWVAWWRQVCGPRWLKRRKRLRVLWNEQRVWENGKILRYYQYDGNLSYKEGLSTWSKLLTGVENTDSSCNTTAVVSNSKTP